MEKYNHLRKNIKGIKNLNWTLDNLKDGIEYFKELNGRYPSSNELNDFDYLPNRKLIERNFGGLVNLRKTLGLKGSSDFTKGKVRSETAKKAFVRSQGLEEIFLKFLISKIPEVRVHEHKIIRPGNTASDFFIYTTDTEGIMIDVFYAQNLHSLAGIIRIKALKAVEVKCPVYYVLLGNKTILQKDIDLLLKNKKVSLPNHIQVMTEDYFKETIIDSIILKPLKNNT